MVKEFYERTKLPTSLISYFLALIPKIDNLQKLGDFRPISLLGCLYKILAKLLASRLRKVMDLIIGLYQSAFLAKRNILDGVIVINEAVDYARKSGKECFILKVDFEKAYDSVNWKFLDYMMGRFGLCNKWRSWIRKCIFNGNLSVLVNGSPTEEVQIQKGLKQGDPLTSFLFLLVAEGLNGLMRSAVSKKKFKGFQVGRGETELSILKYVDDTCG